MAHAQSTVRDIPEHSTEYVLLYSPCRAKPPDDPIALQLSEAMWPPRDFATLSGLFATLRSQPLMALSATEAEAYFLLLNQMESRTVQERVLRERIGAAVLEGRQHGTAIAQRFHDESFVRCAFLASEWRIATSIGLENRFTESERNKARDDYHAFLESALRGEVRIDMYRDVLQSAVGGSYLDKGFEALPDRRKAAPLFEIGARYVLDAASNPTDQRYLGNQRRYVAMLRKLSLAQQIEITNRLLAHMESAWGGKSAHTTSALEVYLDLLAFGGEVSVEAQRGKDAASMYGRYLEVVLDLRRRDPGDPNHQVSEALGYLLAGDAHALNKDSRKAAEAYRAAQRAFEQSNATAKDMLEFQDFASELESRRKALR